MIPDLPIYISISFVLITGYIVFAFTKANTLKRTTLPMLLSWSVLISGMSYLGIYQYQDGDKISRFIFVLLPITLFIVYLVRDKSFYRNRDLRWSTAIHIVRLPVELLLFQLAIRDWLPMEMTFKGWNFDVIPGITSILILLWMKFGVVNKKLLLSWNILGLIFILCILTNGFLSQELFYKKFKYAVANKAIAYFPMVLLAGVIVPIVIYTHITDVILLSRKRNNSD